MSCTVYHAHNLHLCLIHYARTWQSTDWPRLTHWLAARLPVSSADKQSILESNDPIYRLLKLKVQYVKLALMFSGQQGSGAAGGGSGSDRPSS
eukprot:m.121108 g.121108  ORF g.121108 m.121108 type:complete len:93 (+) comp11075_c1_seq1:223-501(+)